MTFLLSIFFFFFCLPIILFLILFFSNGFYDKLRCAAAAAGVRVLNNTLLLIDDPALIIIIIFVAAHGTTSIPLISGPMINNIVLRDSRTLLVVNVDCYKISVIFVAVCPPAPARAREEVPGRINTTHGTRELRSRRRRRALKKISFNNDVYERTVSMAPPIPSETHHTRPRDYHTITSRSVCVQCPARARAFLMGGKKNIYVFNYLNKNETLPEQQTARIHTQS